MPRPPLPHLERIPSRHGGVNYYVRLSRKAKRVPIPGEPYSPAFMEAYRAALAGKAPEQPPASKASLKWLADQWRASSDFRMKADATQKQRNNILHKILSVHGHFPYAKITDSDIEFGRERRMETPFAANNYLKTMKALFAWAKLKKLVAVDPAAEVAFLSEETEGFEPWTPADIAAFRLRWQIGTRARLAMELIYWTGLRRGGAVRLGRQHIGPNGIAHIKAEKTGARIAVLMTPIMPLIEASPTGDLSFICGERGRPMKKESFGTVFRGWCRSAGVAKSAHGLRKLAAQEIAEAGGSEMMLRRMFAWTSDNQSSVYTRNADQDLMVRAGAEKRLGNVAFPNLENDSQTSKKIG